MGVSISIKEFIFMENYINNTLTIKEIMPEVMLGPEAQPRDTNNRVVLLLLDT